ncbi:glycosyltransferase family 4 protein [Nisaea acidiphila]|uniref:Glycosyltransferase family 4 protein n=1 Tax=Nisaea acidiphila TaxID=1862145 RepID=A0A9J7ASR6_9PROT|nr:glycosyltransferase family 4 protein [Nisaea acidiphila]UUX48397.1 glycosyltransferase family 4 protein [Nisaea acidiphila]
MPQNYSQRRRFDVSSIPVCAIHYHPDAYRADRVGVKGRHSAGAGFLTSYFRHGRCERFVAMTPNERHGAEFVELAGALDPRNREVRHLRTLLSQPGAAECLLVSGPNLEEFVWDRRARDQRAYSVCGVTHTLSSDRVIAALCNAPLLPIQPWDALICTSRVARDVVQRSIAQYGDYLERRLGVAPSVQMQLPIIPLGVDGARYAADPEARARLRNRIGASDGDLVVLFLGRFTFHAKAHPVPMYLAAEKAAERLPDRKVHLVMAGQAPNETIMQSYRETAELFTDAAAVHFVDGRDDALIHETWQGSDVFLSLSDNIQETFGLTPIEAMAAGLPAVVSDWDGYKDTVIEGETGFRIPTTAPAAGDGFELALMYQTGRDNYDRFVGRACMSSGCDPDAAADALVKLAEDPDLRCRMGMAGRKRAAEVYDWSVIVRAYEDLWLELRELRRTAEEVTPRRPGEAASPFYPDPFDIFSCHPTSVLGPATIIKAVPGAAETAADFLLRHNFVSFGADFMLTGDELATLLAELERRGSLKLSELEEKLAPAVVHRLRRTLGWLLKFGQIKLGENETD